MKIILILAVLLCVSGELYSQKAWVEKHYREYEQVAQFANDEFGNCYAFTSCADTISVYKSTDKGDTWVNIYEKLPRTTTNQLYNINHCDIVDHNHLYMAYTTDVALEISENGGQTFRRVIFDSLYNILGSTIYGFKMYNDKIGVIATYHGIIITYDNWYTYKVIPKYKKTFSSPMFFIDSANIAIHAWRSNDNYFMSLNIYDYTWKEYSPHMDPPAGEETQIMYDAFIINDSLGFACGGQKYGVGSFATDVIWKTTNKGKQWDICHNKRIEETFPVGDIHFSDKNHGVALGDWGKIIETKDGGKIWEYLEGNQAINHSILCKHFVYDDYILLAASGSIFRYEIPAVSVHNEEKEMDIEITNNYIRVEPPVYDESQILFRLADINGNIYFTKEIQNIGNTIIDISGLSTGTYIYQIINNIGIIKKTGKFIKML